jgi:excisionase family DNA binding protein
MPYSLKQAAKATGKTKTTILRAIQKGRISAAKDGGAWKIDPAELHRVYPPAPQDAAPAPPTEPVQQEVVALLREMVDEMRRERDHWRAQAESHRLADQRNWWRRLFG